MVNYDIILEALKNFYTKIEDFIVKSGEKREITEVTSIGVDELYVESGGECWVWGNMRVYEGVYVEAGGLLVIREGANIYLVR